MCFMRHLLVEDRQSVPMCGAQMFAELSLVSELRSHPDKRKRPRKSGQRTAPINMVERHLIGQRSGFFRYQRLNCSVRLDQNLIYGSRPTSCLEGARVSHNQIGIRERSCSKRTPNLKYKN
jgi:hypothetical protein